MQGGMLVLVSTWLLENVQQMAAEIMLRLSSAPTCPDHWPLIMFSHKVDILKL